MEPGSPTPPATGTPGRPRTVVTPARAQTDPPGTELRRLEELEELLGLEVEVGPTGDLRLPTGETTTTTTGVEVVEVVEVVTGILGTFPGTTSTTTEDLTGTGTTDRTTEAMEARETKTMEAVEVKETKTMEDLSRPNRATPTTGGWRRWRWRRTSSSPGASAAPERMVWSAPG